MNAKLKLTRLSLLSIFVLLAACTPIPPTPAITPVDALQTQAAGTVIAQVTLDALLTPSPAPSLTPTFTETLTLEPTSTVTQTATIAPTPTNAYEVFLDDDFSNQQGWAEQFGDDFGFGYTRDGYRIYVNLLNAAIWSIRGPEMLTDVRVETEARRSEGPADGYFGVLCRLSDEDNYYALLISETGNYGIGRMHNGVFEFLSEGSGATEIIQAGEYNQITGTCEGEKLSLAVNGETLLEVTDSVHRSGSSGLVAKTRLAEGFEALFRRFVLATRK
jgi:hypothetical protein